MQPGAIILKMKFYTIGHSTRSIEEFISLTWRHGIEILTDVRAFPSSSRYPQFNREHLRESLVQAGIAYHWLGKELGGYRKKSEGLGERSPNMAWDAGGFRIYADYMLSDPFKAGIHRLIELAVKKRTALMCAERLYWRCHRRLISDYLVTLGHEVWHIVDTENLRQHKLPPMCRIKDGILTYPAEPEATAPPLAFPMEEPEPE